MKRAGDGHSAIRPLTPLDYDVLHRMATTPGVGDRWRGYAPDISRDDFVASLWTGVLEQVVVTRAGSDDPVGLVTAYNAEPRSGTCSLGVVEHPDHLGTGVALIGAGLFLNHLFREWPMRKVYLEVFDYNLPMMRGLINRVAQSEGVLRGARWWDGRLADQHLLTIERDAWMSDLGRVLHRRAQRNERTRANPIPSDREEGEAHAVVP